MLLLPQPRFVNHSTINKTTPLRIVGSRDTEDFCTCNVLAEFAKFLSLMRGPLACFYLFLDANSLGNPKSVQL
jgi:hypothetical protein